MDVGFNLTCAGVRFKENRFSREHEVRILISRPDESGSFIEGGKRRMKVPIDLASVLRVIRGPNSEWSIGQIRGHLSENGWPVDVVESKVPRFGS